jgi:P-aminobenzoate N-oxygenase AurF
MNTLASQESIRPASGQDPIDFTRWFMPQALTPLYHTPIYCRLSEPQQRRYNQINALYFNEQTMFFEKSLAQNVIGYFLARPLSAELKVGLQQFLAEEEQHTAMFRRLNRKCAPEIYRTHDFHFIKIPALGAKLLDLLTQRPQWFPMLLWLMHLQEERAVFFGQTFLKSGDEIEPHFLEAQRKHLADEVGHVRWDVALLEQVWPKTKPQVRRFNARFLAWMMGEYFSTPKRSALRVVTALVNEFPDLRPIYPELCRQLVALKDNQNFRHSMYSREIVPDTFRRFDAWPEFAALTRVMPGYRRGGDL